MPRFSTGIGRFGDQMPMSAYRPDCVKTCASQIGVEKISLYRDLLEIICTRKAKFGEFENEFLGASSKFVFSHSLRPQRTKGASVV